MEENQKTSITMGSSQFDHPSFATTVKLNGKNYLEWAQSAKVFIGSRKKLGYVTGTKKEPAASDPSHEDWESENLTVMNWHLHSMEPSISRNFLFYSTAGDIWTFVEKTYSKRKDYSCTYQLQTEK